MEEAEKLILGIGFDAKKAKETLKNQKLTEILVRVIKKANAENGCEKSLGVLLYQIASKISPDIPKHENLVVKYVVEQKIKNAIQLDSAYDFLKRVSGEVDIAAFEKATGVGVVITGTQIKETISAKLASVKDQLLEERYSLAGQLLLDLRETLKWGDGRLVKEEFDAQLLALLGPKTDEDSKPKTKKKEALKEKEKERESSGSGSNAEVEEVHNPHRQFDGEVRNLHKPGENPQINPELMKKHLEKTGGKVMTRFPPEPNGFLHIGHAKAMNFNFRYAEAHGGHCYLRFDDTNPEVEETRYYKSIQGMVEWLGFKPYKITATSDYFPELYALAIKVIKNGKAYVCHQTAKEMQLGRGGEDGMGQKFESPWRNRSIEENLREFENMTKGKYKEGEATLRLKIDMFCGNPYMADPVAYRVMYWPHCRTGDEWCVYPTYDFSHCLTDSVENVTHSFCTTEFISQREAYYWICDAAEVYKPVQWEYGRLNITNTVLSKRKLMKLVNEKYVNGWDDPRLYTLEALKRRGFTPTAINTFAERLGITTALTTVNMELLEAAVRDDLNKIAIRAKAVLEPLKVTITNFPEGVIEDRVVLKNPVDPSMGEHTIPFTQVIYIDRTDFRENADNDPDYRRLAPGKEVGLSRGFNITCTDVIKDKAGKIIELKATYDPTNSRKPKAHIQWVAHCPSRNSPVKAEVRIYENLFLSKNPDAVPGGFLNDINPNSLTIIPDALIDVTVLNAKPLDKFQFERIGYFCVDKDSTSPHLIFNKTVNLKDDPKKT